VTPVRVTARGAERWVRGHPWIYRSEVEPHPAEPGLVPVQDPRGRFIGQALLSPNSEIRLRLLERTEQVVDPAWWRARIEAAAARRSGIDATAFRLVHAEGRRGVAAHSPQGDRHIFPRNTARGDVSAFESSEQRRGK
jgi:23S rRNA (cytosine1962-C5)-methyltransferase